MQFIASYCTTDEKLLRLYESNMRTGTLCLWK